jgi:hypothetical protein
LFFFLSLSLCFVAARLQQFWVWIFWLGIFMLLLSLISEERETCCFQTSGCLLLLLQNLLKSST